VGLLDRFKPKPHPLIAWLEEQGGLAYGRKLAFHDQEYNDGSRQLFVSLEGRAEPAEHLQFQRPETYLTAEQAKVLPSVRDADWRARMADDDIPQGLHVGGGFVLDPDFNLDSPVLARHILKVGGYLERFSRSVDQVTYEPPLLRLNVMRDRATPTELRRDVECAHELLNLLEEA
jgi:hypothetical protein